ncbi:MAG TPA: TonB-dependent receptor [Vicinamibacterales bacterium]|nr:TonB-dependent receptor [Vicinamibacterales bacterium]
MRGPERARLSSTVRRGPDNGPLPCILTASALRRRYIRTLSATTRRRGGAASTYAQLSARVGPISITPGARVDRWQATDTTTSSPWITGEWAMTRTMQLRGGAGIYRQFPDLTMLHGLNGNPDLRPERATHADLAIVRTFPNSVSLQVTGYRRDERDVLRIADSEPRRLTDGTIVLGRGDARWSNRLTAARMVSRCFSAATRPMPCQAASRTHIRDIVTMMW